MPEGDHRQVDVTNARRLRREQSPAERSLWGALRNNRLGFKFRRQQAIGPYTADFYCAQAKLVVELDGAYHESRIEQDIARDEWMRAQGLEVLRITASELSKRRNETLERIYQTTQRRIEAPNPNPHLSP